MTVDQLHKALNGRTPGPMDTAVKFAVLVPLVELEGALHLLYEVRAATLQRQPGEVGVPGGRIEEGETAPECALRETQEEVGVALIPESGTLMRSEVRKFVNGERFADILDVWLFEYDGPVELEQATTAEVAQVKWLTKAQIKELFDAGALVYTLEYFFDMVDED